MKNELMTINSNSILAYSKGLNEKLAFCKLLIDSQMLPKSYTKPQSVLTAILQGQELGFSPLAALRNINVIQGVPAIAATGLKAKAIQNGGQFKTITWTDKVCTIKATRAGWNEPEEFTYTIEDAAKQGLTNKDNWRKMPKQMLYARCVSILCRNMWADVLEGVYSMEEMLDATDATFEITEEGAIKVDSLPESQKAAAQPAPSKAAPQRVAPQPVDSGSKFVYMFSKDDPDFPKLVGICRKHKEKVGGGWNAEEMAWIFPEPSKSLKDYLVSAEEGEPEETRIGNVRTTPITEDDLPAYMKDDPGIKDEDLQF